MATSKCLIWKRGPLSGLSSSKRCAQKLLPEPWLILPQGYRYPFHVNAQLRPVHMLSERESAGKSRPFAQIIAKVVLTHAQRFSASFDCTACWTAHDGIVLSSIFTCAGNQRGPNLRLLTGGNDSHIKVLIFLVTLVEVFLCAFSISSKIWDIVPPQARVAVPRLGNEKEGEELPEGVFPELTGGRNSSSFTMRSQCE